MTFLASGLPDFLLQSLKRIGIDTPTNIQSQAIPAILEGRDALITAHTGSGKTLAYLIPKIVGLSNGCKRKILILAPTRELSTQIFSVARSCLSDSPIRLANLIGGQSMVVQLKQLSRNPQIIIGTPGRVFDHLQRRSLKVDDVGCFILDEVDRMLDLGFSQQIEEIEMKLPKERQNLMFSATMPARIVKMVNKYLKDPVRIDDGQLNKPAPKIEHSFEKIAHQDKFKKLIEQVAAREGAVLVFVNRKVDAEKISSRLRDEGLSVDSIHGDLRQGVRDRIIQKFRDQKIRIMVGTDVVARGLDVSHIRHVINYDLPLCPEDYLHRIGRTGRAGESGSAFSMVSPQDNIKMRAIQRLLNPELAKSKDREEQDENREFRRSNRGNSRFGGNGGGRGGFGGSRRRDDGFSPRGRSGFASSRRSEGSSFKDDEFSAFGKRKDSNRPRRGNDFDAIGGASFDDENGGRRSSFGGDRPRFERSGGGFGGNNRRGGAPFERSENEGFGRKRFDSFRSDDNSFSGGFKKPRPEFKKNKFAKKPAF